MPHFAEIKRNDTTTEYLDLEQVYRITVTNPDDPGGMKVEAFFIAQNSPLQLAKDQAVQFLEKFLSWMQAKTLP
jgi:hypothetical protein